jgi:hypothetical protein
MRTPHPKVTYQIKRKFRGGGYRVTSDNSLTQRPRDYFGGDADNIDALLREILSSYAK